MGAVQKHRFIYRFQYHSQDLLHQLVSKGGDSQGTHFLVCFLDISTAGRVWDVSFIRKHFDNSVYLCFAKAIRRVLIYPLG